MRKIWKYALQLAHTQVVEMPEGFEVVHLAEDVRGGTYRGLNFWAIVDPDKDLCLYTFKIFGTGHEILTDPEQLAYVGTVPMADGFVWHVFLVKG